jgi:hypothetical protein
MDTTEDEILYLKSKIKKLQEFLWPKYITWPKVNDWIDNFKIDEDTDKVQLLYLLSQFMFFDTREVRELLKCIYRDKFKHALINSIDSDDHDYIERSLTNDIQNSRFIPVGNPSESGAHLLYYFRQDNKLSKENFLNTSEIYSPIVNIEGKVSLKINNNEVNHYVFIDDLCGSGTQVKEYLYQHCANIRAINPNIKLHYYTMFAMSEGLKFIKKLGIFDYVDTIYTLDETFRCFGDKSRYYQNTKLPISRDKCREICLKVGLTLVPHHPLGYKDCQLLMGFYYNTPDNTLPVIWSTNNWEPMFKRYGKF